MWQKAMDRERKFQTVAENSNNLAADKGDPKELEKKSHEFEKILKVPKEERDRIQRMQVIDRAAAAIAAAQALIKESPALPKKKLSSSENGAIGDQLGGNCMKLCSLSF
ncbi:hypothetical protein GIB67_027098 [Kingdonia uniflora]|uniref:Uncharacterized protein n=1 Tax=Kingdonia uniflora TaxID=39325 RepID=A0A7J7P258_9MAGN|nr:hypothetical protein GIB67_027098 [Kingdonia uniflora]